MLTIMVPLLRWAMGEGIQISHPMAAPCPNNKSHLANSENDCFLATRVSLSIRVRTGLQRWTTEEHTAESMQQEAVTETAARAWNRLSKLQAPPPVPSELTKSIGALACTLQASTEQALAATPKGN